MKGIKGYLCPLLCCFLIAAALPAACSGQAELSVTGTITRIDKHGHAQLGIEIESFEKSGFHPGDIVNVTTEHYSADMPYFNGYYVDKGEPLLRAYPGTKYLALCINYGSFAEVAGAEAGDSVTITLKEAEGALAEQEVNNLVYTNDRTDYSDDTVFANFRPVVTTGIAEGKLYRSASPADNKYGRAAYANQLAEIAGINAVINLANTDEEIAALFGEEGFSRTYYGKLYENGKVIALGLPIAFDTTEFAQGIVRGFTFLSEQDPPYLIHCQEGKDRAGFVTMVAEALMGASEEEIIRDYMISYENYYGVEPGTEKYNMIIEKNILQMLPVITGTDHPEETDLSAATEAYLIRNGMKEEAIRALKEKLSK